MTKLIAKFTGTDGKNDFTEFLAALENENYDKTQREIALALSELNIEAPDFADSISLQNANIHRGLIGYLFSINDLRKKEKKLEKIESMVEQICAPAPHNPFNKLYSPNVTEAKIAVRPLIDDVDLDSVKNLVLYGQAAVEAMQKIIVEQAQAIGVLNAQLEKLHKTNGEAVAALAPTEKRLLERPTTVVVATSRSNLPNLSEVSQEPQQSSPGGLLGSRVKNLK